MCKRPAGVRQKLDPRTGVASPPSAAGGVSHSAAQNVLDEEPRRREG